MKFMCKLNGDGESYNEKIMMESSSETFDARAKLKG